MLGRPLSRPDPRNESAVLAHILSHVIRIKDDGRIEICEKDDAGHVEQVVQRHPVGQLVSHCLPPAPGWEHARNRCRKCQNRRRKNNRNDATRVHLQRNVRTRTTVHPSTHYSLGVLHDDPAMSAFDKNHRRHYRNHERD